MFLEFPVTYNVQNFSSVPNLSLPSHIRYEAHYAVPLGRKKGKVRIISKSNQIHAIIMCLRSKDASILTLTCMCSCP